MEQTITKIEFPNQLVKHGRKQLPEALKPFMFKKGVSGNPNGRPKRKSLKEYTREYLAQMDDEERIAFLSSIKPEFIWSMAEGSPRSMVEIEEPYNLFENMTDEEVVENLRRYLKQYEGKKEKQS